ncbi:MAG: YfhO family protein [bacterium]
MRELSLAAACFSAISLLFFSSLFLHDRVLVTSDFRWYAPWRTHTEIAADTGFRFDSALTYTPRRILSRAAMLAGRAPLWNPHAALGTPLLADYQTAPFYPVNLLLLPFDTFTAMGLFMIVHFALAGIFMYVFLRGLGLSAIPAAFGALAFQWNGYFISYVGHPTHIATGAWLPVLMHLARRALLAPAPRRFPLAFTLALASLLLAGFPQTLVYSVYALSAYVLFVLAFEVRTSVACRASRVAPLLACALIAFALAAPELLPTAQLSGLSPHRAFTHAGVWEINDIPFVTYLKIVFPNLFGNPIDGTSWLAWPHMSLPHPNDLGVVGYAGALTPLLALAGVVAAFFGERIAGRRRETVFALGMILVPILFMSVRAASRLLWQLPGWGFSTELHRIEFLAFVGGAILAARGLEAVLAESRTAQRARAALLGAAALVALFFCAFLIFAPGVFAGIAQNMLIILQYAGKGAEAMWLTPRMLRYISSDVPGWIGEMRGGVIRTVAIALAGCAIVMFAARNAAQAGTRGATGTIGARGTRGALIAGAAILLLHVIDVTGAARRYNTPQPREGVYVETDGIRFLREMVAARPGRLFRIGGINTLPPNIPSVFGLSDAGGYNALLIAEYGEYFDAIERGAFSRGREVIRFENAASFDAPLFRLVAAPYVLAGDWREAGPLFAAWPFSAARRIAVSKPLQPPTSFSLSMAGGEPAFLWSSPGEVRIPRAPGGATELMFEWETLEAGSTRLAIGIESAGESRPLVDREIGGAAAARGALSVALPSFREDQRVIVRVGEGERPIPRVRISRFTLAGGGAINNTPALRPGWRFLYADDLIVFEYDRALPRARLVDRTRIEPDRRRALRRLAAGEIDVSETALVDRAPSISVADADGAPGDAKIVRDEPERVEIEVDAQRASLLVLADLYYPGWEATLDGARVEILRANSLFRAVAVPAGTHRVVFRFVSPPFRRGAGLAIAGLAALAAIGAVSVKRRVR